MSTPDPKIRSWAPKVAPVMNKQKMGAEKTSRTPASELLTEPHSASYGQKPFWRVPAKILKYLGGKSFSQKGKSCIQNGKSCIQKGKPSIQKGESCMQEGKSCIRKGKPCMQEGKSCIQERESQWDQWDHGTRDHGTRGHGTRDHGTRDRDQGPWDQGPGTGTGTRDRDQGPRTLLPHA